MSSARVRRLVVVAAGALMAGSVGSSLPVLALSDGSQSPEAAIEQAEIDFGSGFGVKSSVVAGVSGNFASVLAPKTTGIFDRSATLGTGVTPQVAAGVGHTCALLNTGAVNCWGSNSEGQLGNGTTTDSSAPVAVDPFTNGATAVSITAGRDHTCAVLNTGAVNCWGYNSDGQLGNNSTTSNSLEPVAVSTFTDGATAVSITASHDHTCAVLNTGAVNCWGNNEFGQLGNDSTADSLVPVAVDPFTVGSASAVSIAAGSEHTCAVLDTGVVNCWGNNDFGQLGNDSTTDSLVPVAVDPFTDGSASAVSIAADYLHTCAVLDTGVVNCWGNNDFGQLGNNSTTKSLVPVAVDPFTDGATAVSIAAGFRQACAVLNTGVVNCWGYNGLGQLGNNSTAHSSVPVAVNAFTDGSTAVSIAAGDYHTCAVLNTGVVNCWGYGGEGQLGNNSTADSLVPVAVDPFTVGSASAGLIAAGVDHTCALLDTGVVNCWGDNGFGQLGNNSTTDSLVPVAVDAFTDGASAVSIAAGDLHTCAVLDTGVVNCWGYNADGQLGNNSTAHSLVPVAVDPFTVGSASAVSIAAGAYHTCAVLDTGVVNCWGFNGFGQLGNDSTADSLVPVAVDPFTVGSASAVSITVGADHTCAVLDTGVVNCWGDNADGQLGNDSTTESLVPVAVNAFIDGSTAASIAAGDYHTCAVLNTGVVNCWGDNADGQLGNNSTADSSVPVGVDPFTVGSASAGLIAAGVDHTCAVLNTGVVNCWGDNADGQLGNNSRTDSLVPVAVDAFTDGSTAASIAAGRDHTCAVLNTGVVNCWGKNNFGQLGNNSTETSSVPVKVTSVTVPGVPTAVSATAGNGQATVVWTAPVSDGGSEISGYTVTSSPDNKTCTTTGASTCTVTGLTNGTSYTFAVISINDQGNSPASAASGAVTPATVPGVPTAVSATAGNGQATVVWTAPVSDGGSEISGYTVTSSPDNKTCTTTGASTCTVTGLTNGTSYTFAVISINDQGNSPASAASGAVTPATVPGAPTGVVVVAGDSVFAAVGPDRAIDTRVDGGERVSAGGELIVPVGAQYAGKSISVNLTATAAVAPGFATLFACDQARPETSSLNFPVGRPIANGVITKVSAQGTVCVYMHRSGHVILDVFGVFESESVFAAVGPDRAIDTRVDGGERVSAGGELIVPVGAQYAGKSISVNLTATAAVAPGFATLFACDQARPETSSLNFPVGRPIANGVITKVSAQGTVCVYMHRSGHVILDVFGVFESENEVAVSWTAPASDGGSVISGYTVTSSPDNKTCTTTGAPTCTVTGLTNGTAYAFTVTATNSVGTGSALLKSSAVVPAAFAAVGPDRAIDTRVDGGERVSAGGELIVPVGAQYAGKSISVNLTATAAVAPGFATLFACDQARPETSSLNFPVGRPIANGVITKVSAQGTVCVYMHRSGHVILDVFGVFP